MWNIGKTKQRHCRGVTRREVLQAGAVGALGLTLANAPGVAA